MSEEKRGINVKLFSILAFLLVISNNYTETNVAILFLLLGVCIFKIKNKSVTSDVLQAVLLGLIFSFADVLSGQLREFVYMKLYNITYVSSGDPYEFWNSAFVWINFGIFFLRIVTGVYGITSILRNGNVSFPGLNRFAKWACNDGNESREQGRRKNYYYNRTERDKNMYQGVENDYEEDKLKKSSEGHGRTNLNRGLLGADNNSQESNHEGFDNDLNYVENAFESVEDEIEYGDGEAEDAMKKSEGLNNSQFKNKDNTGEPARPADTYERWEFSRPEDE